MRGACMNSHRRLAWEIPPQTRGRPTIAASLLGPFASRTFLIVFLVVEVFLFVPSAKLGLVADDFVFAEVAERPILLLWTSSADAHGHYRPLSYSIKHLLYGVLGERALGWHIVNMTIHFSTVLMLFWMLMGVAQLQSVGGAAAAALGSFLIQIHPSSLQNVYWSSGLSELLAVFFVVATLFFMVRFLTGGSDLSFAMGSLCFLCSVLSKESAVVFPVVLLTTGWMAADWGEGSRFDMHAGRRWRKVLWSLFAMSGLFLVAVSVIGGSRIAADFRYHGQVDSFLLVAKGVAMVVVPEDAWTIYAALESTGVWWMAFIVTTLLCMVLFSVLRGNLSLKWVLGFAICLILVMLPYEIGGYVAQRLVYGGVLVLSLYAFFLCNRSNKGARRAWDHGFFAAFLVYMAFMVWSSLGVSRDWSTADRAAREIRSAFLETCQTDPRDHYLFVALPNRLRQAWIVGEPSTDFAAALRSAGVRPTPAMESIARVVFADGIPDMGRIEQRMTGIDTLYLSTKDPGVYLLFGDISSALDQPLGVHYRGSGFDIEVLSHGIGSRASALRVVLDSSRREDLLALRGSIKGYQFRKPVPEPPSDTRRRHL